MPDETTLGDEFDIVDPFAVRDEWDRALKRASEISPAIRDLLTEWEDCMVILTREVYPEYAASRMSHDRHRHIAETLIRGSKGARP